MYVCVVSVPVSVLVSVLVCVCVVPRAHASLLQEELSAKILHHLQPSSNHWKSFREDGFDMAAICQEAQIWTEEPVAYILNIAARCSCIVVLITC